VTVSTKDLSSNGAEYKYERKEIPLPRLSKD